MTRYCLLSRFLVAFFALPVWLLAQFDTASVLGTIRDPKRSAIPRAVVTLTDLGRGVKVQTSSDDDGGYQFVNLSIGRYQVTVVAPGFVEGRAEAFDLNVGTRQRVDFDLNVAGVETTVNVSEAAIRLVESDTSDRSQLVNSQQVVELPLNGRAYSQLVFLSAGVNPTPSSGFGGSAREGTFSANGLRSVYNNFLLDGVDNNYYGTSNQGFSNQVTQLPPDAVAEFKVTTNNMSAEYGRAGGATVNVAMRGGTNEFHGALWHFFRNTRLNATGFFKPFENRKPQLNRNQFGGILGGPVVRNRFFFFADYEGYREATSSVAFATLPTAELRRGLLGVPVRNPLTGALHGAGVIPEAEISPFARRVLQELPLPNSAGLANNFRILRPVREFRDKGDLKLDYIPGDSLRFFARYSHSRADLTDPGTIPGLAGGDGNGFTRIPVFQLTGGMNWTLGPASILEARMGFSRSLAGKDPPLAGGPSMQDLFGIGGLPTDRRFTGGITSTLMVGFTGLGRQATNPQYQHPYLWNPKVNFTRLAGRHTLKLGAEYQRLHVEQLDVNPILGRDIYAGFFSVGIPNPPATALPLYSFADFLFGARSQFQLVNPLVVNGRQWMAFGYLQDDWKVTEKLTMNLGLRYEFSTPYYERDNLLSNWDRASNSVVRARAGSLFDRSLVNPDTNNFGPRLGLAWSFTPRTVLRVGYGVSYVHWNRTGTSYLAFNPPHIIFANRTQAPNLPGFRTTQQGYPADFTAPGSFDPLNQVVQHVDPDSPSGSVQSWFVSIQREVLRDLLVDIGYVGNTANHLILIHDVNQALPNPPDRTIPLQQRRPNPSFSSIAGTLPLAFSNYNGLQVRVEKRSSTGLYLLNNFTWSRTMDNGVQALDFPSGSWTGAQNLYDLNAERSRSVYDRKIVNVTSLVYNLPLGKGRRFGASWSRAADLVLGGWQLTVINSYRTGAPFNLTYTPGAAQEVVPVIPVFGRNQVRPNVSGPVNTPVGQRGPNNWLIRANVSIPTASEPFGTAGRNIGRGPDFFQLDLGVQKFFALTESVRLQFRTESFNATNRTNFGVPDGNISNPSFGQIRSAGDPRQFQFALKLLF